MLVPGPQNCCRHDMCTACSRTNIVRGNYVRETSVKRRNKIVQEITRNVANIFSFYAIIAIEQIRHIDNFYSLAVKVGFYGDWDSGYLEVK